MTPLYLAILVTLAERPARQRSRRAWQRRRDVARREQRTLRERMREALRGLCRSCGGNADVDCICRGLA